MGTRRQRKILSFIATVNCVTSNPKKLHEKSPCGTVAGLTAKVCGDWGVCDAEIVRGDWDGCGVWVVWGDGCWDGCGSEEEGGLLKFIGFRFCFQNGIPSHRVYVRWNAGTCGFIIERFAI